MKLVKTSKLVILSITIFLFSVININAHEGIHGDISVEGHNDMLNISNLGNYHYHHGEEAYLHQKGVCEFRKLEALEDGKEDGKKMEKKMGT